jgi:RimJ/RimL family protein N-acetyltransferase
MLPPTTFETNRLIIRQPRLTDCDAISANYAQDPEAVRYLIWRPHKDIQETEDFLNRCVQAWAEQSEFPWAITLKGTGELIGMVGLRIDGFKADLGYVLGRRWWGNGFATEAVSAIVNWSMSQPTIYRVWAMCDVENAASARVLEKAGMTREGVLRRSTMHPNVSHEPRDSYCYAIVK